MESLATNENFVHDVSAEKTEQNNESTGPTITHTNEKLHSCTICHKSMTTSISLKNHLMLHTGEKPFSCTFCDKTFAVRIYLRNHMKVHKIKPFPCKFCDRSFNKSDYLNCHMRSHTGANPYTCDVCNRSFCRKSVLKKHFMRKHSEKNSNSSVMSYETFNDKNNRLNGLKENTEEELNQCTVCNQTFATYSDFMSHLLKI